MATAVNTASPTSAETAILAAASKRRVFSEAAPSNGARPRFVSVPARNAVCVSAGVSTQFSQGAMVWLDRSASPLCWQSVGGDKTLVSESAGCFPPFAASASAGRSHWLRGLRLLIESMRSWEGTRSTTAANKVRTVATADEDILSDEVIRFRPNAQGTMRAVLRYKGRARPRFVAEALE